MTVNSQLVSGLPTERVVELLTNTLTRITITYKRADIESGVTLIPTLAFDWKE